MNRFIHTLLISLLLNCLICINAGLAEANNSLASPAKQTLLSFKPDIILDTQDDFFVETQQEEGFFVLNNNEFVTKTVNDGIIPVAFKIPENKLYKPNKLIKAEIEQTTNLYETITLDDEDLNLFDIDNVNYSLSMRDPCESMSPMIFKEEPPSPFVNRLKTVYFLTALSTYIGQSGQIQDAFTKGKSLTGGGISLSEYYGYNNVFRNIFVNPFSRAAKGWKVDDSGTVPNFTLHPLFGFGISSYLTASGASPKEALLISLADNFIFEYVVEGTYVAPSGLDLLTTSGGCFAGYLLTRYVFKKPFQKILKGTSYMKDKLNMTFDPIIEPGYIGKGMKFGSQVTFSH